MKAKFTLSVVLIVCAFSTGVFAQLADSPWPCFMHDAQHTGRSQYSGPDKPTLKWVFQIEGTYLGSPAIGEDGTIYSGSGDGKLYAINPDGTLKWKFLASNQLVKSPAINADGTIYIASYDAYLYAINPDGTLKWKFLMEKT